jgi:two-component system response regulator PilR (NtrC family)
VRVIAATAKPLEAAVERGEFRADLFYRLNVVRLHIPPLRERPEDVPGLLTHFVRQAATRLGHPVSITPAALDALTHHGWPGNVRELRNAVERAAVLGTGGPLEPRDFALARNGRHPGEANGRHGDSNGARYPNGSRQVGEANGTNGADYGGPLDLKTQVEAVERQAILRALEASGGNRRQAASLLGISLRTLFYKMRRLPVH